MTLILALLLIAAAVLALTVVGPGLAHVFGRRRGGRP